LNVLHNPFKVLINFCKDCDFEGAIGKLANRFSVTEEPDEDQPVNGGFVLCEIAGRSSFGVGRTKVVR
jgi:hypothetical protein